MCTHLMMHLGSCSGVQVTLRLARSLMLIRRSRWYRLRRGSAVGEMGTDRSHLPSAYGATILNLSVREVTVPFAAPPDLALLGARQSRQRYPTRLRRQRL